jgi:hypothetical protein
MKRYDARKAVTDALKEAGLYRQTEENPGMIVPICRFLYLNVLYTQIIL